MASSGKRGGATSVWTPANIVTCVRIVFIPVFMVLSDLSYHNGSGQVSVGLAFAAFALYVILSLTDKVDGYLSCSCSRRCCCSWTSAT